jgi:hypothetical protein
MSAFYDQASLVVVPSGYKSGKIYAQKPLTTDGQLTFTRASTATRVNASGLIETVASGVPRLDYLGSSCPKLQLEPQRSNLVTRSETFENAAWTKYLGATVTANTVISPDGTQNADTLNALASSTQEIYNGGSKAASAITYTFSCFAKYNGSLFTMVASDFATSGTTANFNLQTGTVVSITVGSTWSNGSAKIENYGNGWYRCIFTATSPATSGLYISLTGTTYIWGCQIEQGAYVTSYVKTEAAAVTRLADFVSKTFPFMSSSGYTSTFFIEFDGPLDPGTIDQIRWYPLAALSARFWIYTNVIGSAAAPLGYAFNKNNLKHKIIFRVENSTSISIFYNGAKVASSTSATLSANFDTVEITGALLERGAKLAQMLAFSSSLNDAKCIELTTL